MSEAPFQSDPIPFQLNMKVRDYECDMQGIVNNAIYQHYLEHARHEYLQSKGLSFAELTRQGIIVVVIRAELDYKGSLHAGEEFTVSVCARQVSRVKFAFSQEIRRKENGELTVQAVITATSLNERKRPYFPAELSAIL